MTKKKQTMTKLIKKPDQVESLRLKLEDPKVSDDEKKSILMELAHLGTEAANNGISNFKKSCAPEDELYFFAQMALEEGLFMTTSDEELVKKAVWDKYTAILERYQAKLESHQYQIAEYKYELEVVKRLVKKATKETKEDWNLEEMVQSDLLKMEENRKQEIEKQIAVTEAILKEIEPELSEDVRNANWSIDRDLDECDCCACNGADEDDT